MASSTASRGWHRVFTPIKRSRQHVNPLKCLEARFVPIGAADEHDWHEFGFEDGGQRVAWRRVDARAWSWLSFFSDPSKPLHLDIGCGNGALGLFQGLSNHAHSTIQASERVRWPLVAPHEHNFLGLDVRKAVIFKSLSRLVGATPLPVEQLSTLHRIAFEPPHEIVADLLAKHPSLDHKRASRVVGTARLISHCVTPLPMLRGLVFFGAAHAQAALPRIGASYPGRIARVSILFPDPTFKPNQQARALVNTEFVEALKSTLAPGALVVVKTDVASMFDAMSSTFAASQGFERLPEDACEYLDLCNQVVSFRELGVLQSSRTVHCAVFRLLSSNHTTPTMHDRHS